MAIYAHVLDKSTMVRAGNGPSSRRTMFTCTPKVCSVHSAAGKDMGIPRNNTPISLAALHTHMGVNAHLPIGVYNYYGGTLSISATDPQGLPVVGYLLIAFTFVESRLRMVGNRASSGRRFTVFVRVSDSVLPGNIISLRYQPAEMGNVFTVFSGRGFIVPARTVTEFLPAVDEEDLERQFGEVFSDQEDFSANNFGLFSFATDTPAGLQGGTEILPTEWETYLLHPDQILVTEVQGREVITVADVTPKRKRKLLLKRK